MKGQQTGGLSRVQFFAIISSFWVYVTLSNVLYAYSMRTGISRITNVSLFAEWDARVMQHLLLFPFVLISYWASLRIQWRPLWFTVPLQVLLGSVFSAIAYPAMVFGQLLLYSADEWNQHSEHAAHGMLDPYTLSLWLASFASFLPAYGFGLALVTGFALYSRVRDSELHVAALEREWSAARLAALRMQLSPHTLFNLLHTIRGYIEWDPKDAQNMVVQLADLLRRLLNAGERDFTRLADELHFVRLYLELQQRRFPDRLLIDLPAAETVCAVWVPSLILQPLVENAVVHGMAGHQAAVRVRLTAEVHNGVVTLRVANTIAANRSPGEPGIGVKNVRERLKVQFDGNALLNAGVVGEEWISEIRLPEILESPERPGVRKVSSTVLEA